MVRLNTKISAPSILFLSVMVSIFCTLVIASLSPSLTLAAPPLPPRPGSDLPPRPNPNRPLSTFDKSGAAEGAYISLQPSAPAVGLWTVVQWQDDLGRWHEVEGWQGTFDGDHKTWWVDVKDFKTGPFRWVVFQDQNGEPLMYSEPFYLPQSPFETVVIEIRSGA